MLNRLLAVSLAELRYSAQWQTYEYNISPLAAQWLYKQGTPPPGLELLRIAAQYLRYLFRYERNTLNQAIIVHQALRRVKAKDEADRFALDYIISPLNNSGLFQTLLMEWLPDICQSKNQAIRSEALGQTGKQHYHLGDYDTALKYLKQSLTIQQEQEIGDNAGLCATLFNMGHIHLQNEKMPQAMQAWLTVYRIVKPMNLAQVLDALENLAVFQSISNRSSGHRQFHIPLIFRFFFNHI